jgi:hypothetical protein
MKRYDERQGYARQPQGRGMQGDPNYSGGIYHGMRMPGEGRGAPYGWHRLSRSDDLELFGGYRGHGEPRVKPGFYGYDRDHRGEKQFGYEQPDPSRRPGSGQPQGRRAAGGGVARSLYDRQYLRDFNAHSPALDASASRRRLQGGPGGPQREVPDRASRTLRQQGIDPEYGNRGRGSGGFADR